VTDLSYRDAEKLLLRLGNTAERVLLVGGQAVNFWANYFELIAPELQRDRPFTSKDIDIVASRRDVSDLAERLHGKARIAGFDDNTASLATVAYVDDHGVRRILDVMNTIFGVDGRDLERTSLQIDYRTASATTLRFRVMHPVLVMESRANNVVRLPSQYNTNRGLRQADASVICVREYLSELIHRDVESLVKEARNWNERIFCFRTKNEVGRKLADVYKIDVFDAIVVDSRLGEKFVTVRYPQMVAAVDRLKP
jgi:hypothetical protein